MSWPSPEEFREAVQVPRLSIGDADLKHGVFAEDRFGLPRVSSGNFASVYRVRCNDAEYAFRCFLSPAPEREERYRALSNFILHDDLECTVDFHFLEQGINVKGQWFPAVKMDWVEGIELDAFINAHADEPELLTELSAEFAVMMRSLHDAGIAHSDLQHGNVIVTDSGLRLVDYDGMYVPDLKGRNSNELGHRNYQHPARSDEHFGAYLDHFSAWLIHGSLLCIARDQTLWRGLRDCLILNQKDFLRPDRSMAFSILEHHNDEVIRTFGTTMRTFLLMEPSEVPPLHSRVELEKLPALLPPAKMREILEKEIDEELFTAPPLTLPLSSSKRSHIDTTTMQEDRLRVTSEVKYLGLSMGASELALLLATRPSEASGVTLEPAGRDIIRRISHLRSADKRQMMLVGEDFQWIPYFWLAYHEGQEVLVRISGYIEPSRRKEFADWARKTMRGTWVTDGISRFHFREDSGKLTYELASYKPRAREWEVEGWDWLFWGYDPPQLWMRRQGQFQLPALRWGATLDTVASSRTVRTAVMGNTTAVRVAEPQTFGGIAMTAVFHFVQPYPLFQPRLYQVEFDIPPGLKRALRQNLVLEYGWPNAHDIWYDECATPWSPDNTIMRWENDVVRLTYLPLALCVNTQAPAKGGRRRIAPPSKHHNQST